MVITFRNLPVSFLIYSPSPSSINYPKFHSERGHFLVHLYVISYICPTSSDAFGCAGFKSHSKMGARSYMHTVKSNLWIENTFLENLAHQKKYLFSITILLQYTIRHRFRNIYVPSLFPLGELLVYLEA